MEAIKVVLSIVFSVVVIVAMCWLGIINSFPNVVKGASCILFVAFIISLDSEIREIREQGRTVAVSAAMKSDQAIDQRNE